MRNYQKHLSRFLTLFLITLLFITVPSLTSCNSSEGNPNTNTLEITDDLGRTVNVPKDPQKVASLLGSYSDVWLLAGGELCASANDAWEDFGLDLNDAVRLGGAHSPNLEALLSADPDLVIASASTASHIDLLGVLEDANISVLYFDVDNFNDYLNMLDTLTNITGRRDLYKKHGTDIKAEIELIKEEYLKYGASEKEKRFLLLRASSTSVKAKGSRGTVLGEMLADMGLINVADNDTSLLENLSAEAVIQEDPYRIFVVTMGNNTEAAKASVENMMKENPAWGALSASKEGRLHIMDKTLFNLKPNSRWAEAYSILYEILKQS